MSSHTKRPRPVQDICLRYALPYAIRQDAHSGGARHSEIFVPPAERIVYGDGPVRVLMVGGNRVTSDERTSNLPGVGPTTAPGDFRRTQ